MIELGKVLKERRVVLGMDLEDVERRTKIRTRYLEALENGDWSVLPGEVYARGFVRSYAECVGLDGLELLERYVDQPHAEAMTSRESQRPEKAGSHSESGTARPVDRTPQAEPPTPKHVRDNPPQAEAQKRQPDGKSTQADEEGVPYLPPSTWKNNSLSSKPVKSRVKDKRPARVGSIVGQGLAVVAAFAVLAGAWYWLSGSHGSNSPVAADNLPGNVPGAAANNAANQTSATGDGSGSNNTAGTSGNDASNTTGSTGNSADNSTSGQPAAKLSVQPYDAKNNTLTVLASTSGSVVLDASAQGGKCWIQVFTDGKSTDPNDFIVPGQAKTFSASKEIRIDLGNVPVVSVTVNGQAVTLPNTQHPIWLVVKKQS